MNYRILGGALVSTVLAGTFFYYFKYCKCKIDKPEKYYYENEYIEEFENLDENTLNVDISDNSIPLHVTEETPNGTIIMYFDLSYNHYKYYINDKNIPYKYLETVARKFCITHNCKSHYVELFKEIFNSRKKMIEEQNTPKLNKPSLVLNNVFAKFKKYKTKNEKKYVVPEKTNNYKYMGKLDDFNKKTELQENKKLSYSDFKLHDISNNKTTDISSNLLTETTEPYNIRKIFNFDNNITFDLNPFNNEIPKINQEEDSDSDYDSDSDLDLKLDEELDEELDPELEAKIKAVLEAETEPVLNTNLVIDEKNEDFSDKSTIDASSSCSYTSEEF